MNIDIRTGVDRTALGAYTALTGTHEVITWVVDILNRYAEKYRAKDLPAIGAIAYGDPLGLTLPIIAVIPFSWTRRKKDSSTPAFGVEKRDRVTLRVYLEIAEGTDPRTAYEPVTRSMDYLAAIFMEHLHLETNATPAIRRVHEAWPSEGRIATWVERLRATSEAVAVRGAEIDLDVLAPIERVTNP